MVLACGLVLADRGTVTGMAAAAGIGRQWRKACWFFAAARWDPDALGLAVARMAVKYLLSGDDPIVVAVDCTFFRRWGRRVHEARWAYDGAAQGGKKIAFGNTWAVLAIVVRLPCCPSPVALPVLFRLWRGKGTASPVQLAAQLLTVVKGAFPGRAVHGTGDAAFHGKPLAIEGVTWTTRLPASYDLGIFTLDTSLTAEQAVERYSWRWAIEPSNAAGKQITGASDARTRTQKAVERAVPFAFLIQSLMITWYAISCDPAAGIENRRRQCPWYRAKATPSAADMRDTLRAELPAARISAIGPGQDQPSKSSPGVQTCDATAA